MKELDVNSRRKESDLGVIESAIKVRLCSVCKTYDYELDNLYLT